MKLRMQFLLMLTSLMICQGSALATQATANLNVALVYTHSTCEVTTKDVDVPMGTYSTKDFQHASLSPSVFFNITFSCDEAMQSVEMVFNGVANEDDPTLFALTNAGQPGVADGLGLYLYNVQTGFPMAPGKSGGTVAATGGTQDIEYGARYEKTGSVVTAGTANAAVTFTMNYE